MNSPLGLRVGLEGLGMDWEGGKSGMLMPAFRAKTKKDKKMDLKKLFENLEVKYEENMEFI